MNLLTHGSMVMLRHTFDISVSALRGDMDLAWNDNVLDKDTAQKYEEILERKLNLF